MKLIERWRNFWAAEPVESAEVGDTPLAPEHDPFDEPVVLEITDTIDLHSIPPKQVKEIVEEYLQQAHARGFAVVRIIHGKGIGVQREAVRTILSRTEFVSSFYDAPGNLGATIAELRAATPNQSK
ncbi:MAG: Smr/MutS family protein [Acidobacteria bacterium]|nr:Smr/MutS family protein [Acidobacteriota bacterium]